MIHHQRNPGVLGYQASLAINMTPLGVCMFCRLGFGCSSLPRFCLGRCKNWAAERNSHVLNSKTTKAWLDHGQPNFILQFTNLFEPRTTTSPFPFSLSSSLQATVTLQSPRAALSSPTLNSVSHVEDSEPAASGKCVVYFVVCFRTLQEPSERTSQNHDPTQGLFLWELLYNIKPHSWKYPWKWLEAL